MCSFPIIIFSIYIIIALILSDSFYCCNIFITVGLCIYFFTKLTIVILLFFVKWIILCFKKKTFSNDMQLLGIWCVCLFFCFLLSVPPQVLAELCTCQSSRGQSLRAAPTQVLLIDLIISWEYMELAGRSLKPECCKLYGKIPQVLCENPSVSMCISCDKPAHSSVFLLRCFCRWKLPMFWSPASCLLPTSDCLQFPSSSAINAPRWCSATPLYAHSSLPDFTIS